METYTKSNPFPAFIKERYNLCREGSQKHTYHIVLDLKDSNITYSPGDSVGILPSHNPQLVQRTLKAMRATGNERIQDSTTGFSYSLLEFLTHHVSITGVQKKLIAALAERQTDFKKKEVLVHLLSPENRQLLTTFLEEHELWDLLEEHPEATFSPQELCQLLLPMLPRFYSIASSSRVTPKEIHLTVALLHYDGGQTRSGVCTHYLCQLAEIGKTAIPIFIQPSHGFGLPEDLSSSLIMVGPGTGVAPYRCFLQERIAAKASGRHWLFFGECHQSLHFFYEDYWRELESQGVLKLDVAFSRDQAHKVYVQHKMKEKGAELFQWLQEGAYLYVCGDANQMAKDVEMALHEIIKTHGQMNDTDARLYIRKLRADKKYRRDVY